MNPGLLASLLFASAVSASQPPASPPSAPLPLRAYVDRPQIQSPALAPDGHALAIIANRNGVRRVEIYNPAGHLTQATANLSDRPVEVAWIDNIHLGIEVQQVMDESRATPQQLGVQIVSWNPAAGKSVVLLSRAAHAASIVAGGLLQPGILGGRSVMFMNGLSVNSSIDLFAADAETGGGALMAAGGLQALQWVVTPQGEVLARSERETDNGSIRFFVKGAQGWKPLMTPSSTDIFALEGLGARPRTVLLASDNDWFEVSLDGSVSPTLTPDGWSRPVHLSDFASGRLIVLTGGVQSVPPVFFDKPLAECWPGVVRAFPGKTVDLVSVDGSRRNLVVSTEGPQDAGSFYWVDLARHAATLIDETRPTLQGGLSPVETFSFSAADGLALTGTITRPRTVVSDSAALPAVVLVDGVSDIAGYDGFAQGLASRGYAVIKVAYRGSRAKDRTLHEAGRGELGRRSQTDLSDAVAALQRTGRIDPHRVCIFGLDGADHGYAALAGITLQHGLYRCAIAVQPVVDLPDAVERPHENEGGAGWSNAQAWREELGPVSTKWLELRARSPLFLAPKADAPALIITYRFNPNGHAQGVEMADALRRTGKPVEEERYNAKPGPLGDLGDAAMVLERAVAFLKTRNPTAAP